MRPSDITVSVVIRISAYSILCKFAGPEGRKKPGLNRVKGNIEEMLPQN